MIGDLIKTAVGWLYGYGLVYLLIAVGLGLTVYLAAPQITHARDIFTSIFGSTKTKDGGISSFQAFAIGVATRVGIGNIGGVALALIVGGPGAIFWMWVVAAIGMATAFAESSMAQLFKVRHSDASFRGGPAYYMARGLGWKVPAVLMAVITMFASGVSVPMVQVNTVAATLDASHGIPTWVTAVLVMLVLAPVVIGGVRWVARVSEAIVPVMAVLYILLTIVIIIVALVTNPASVGNAFARIFQDAFGWHAAAGGTLGAIMAALINGARRGLFSNEAGLGSSPNAAGTATVAHPASQGFIQSLGVFIDTMIVCTCTALMILIAIPALPADPNAAGSLATAAVVGELGNWAAWPMSIIIFIFGYTSAFGAYSYGQVSLDYISTNRVASLAYRIFVVACCGLGAVTELSTVWALADLTLGLGAIINLIALVALAPWVRALLRDWDSRRGGDKQFTVINNRYLPRKLRDSVWEVGS